MSSKRVYGIDLGTTYSCIAHVDEHGQASVLSNAEGQLTTPSVVYFESADSIGVGEAAKSMAAMHPELFVATVKRAMGDPDWIAEFHGNSYRPQDISSFILRKLVKDAEMITGQPVEEVVITCPAYFGVNEKEATKQAGALAGLSVRYVIPEPTAAALAYGFEQTQDQVILVYDLGGGTFDVTLIEIQGGQITVVCTGGDHQLGGKDWDEALVDHLANRFEEESGISADTLREDPEAFQDLLRLAEEAKKRLSTLERVTQRVVFDGQRVEVEVTRETFNQITSNLLERTLSLTEQVLERAGKKGFNTVDKLLLVGGSTYMPQVKEAVRERFRFEILQFDPNQAVAKGAALFGHKCFLEEEIKIRIAEETGQEVSEVEVEEVAPAVREEAERQVAQEHGFSLAGVRKVAATKVTNVSSKSFGIVVMNSNDREVVANLIELDEKVPKKVTQSFGTHEEGQVQVDLRCMENQVSGQVEVEIGDCSKEVGSAVLAFSRALPKGSPIEITFDLGPDGLLKLYGRDLTTLGEIQAEFRTDSIMTKEEEEAARSRNLAIQVA